MAVPESPREGRAFTDTIPFELDGFQAEAIEAVGRGESVLMTAPTGSGKTVVAEYACWLAVQRGAKCFYTTPLKALSNQKFGDLIARHGARNVGLLTGDNTINGEAPLVVMTTEVLRNMLYEGSSTLQGLRWVVLDEVHYLQDPYRGAVWEEVMIHLPSEVRVVCLSATVSNHEQFGAWIEDLRGPTRVVLETQRPVELRSLVMVGEHLHPLFVSDGRQPQVNPDLVRAWARGEASAQRHGYRAPSRARRRPGEKIFTPTRVEVAEVLEREKMLPAICFIFSRVGCDKSVEACIYAGLRLTSAQEAERAREFAVMRAAELDPDDLRALGFPMFLDGLERGVAAHHAGMLPVFKETVEELFALGLVKVVFATETLSLGINMPAKTVVIERLTKFTGERHELLTPTDYTQLTGRAGRRGIDELGYAVTLYSPWVPIDKLASLATVRAYELASSFRLSYNMAVNLVRNYTPDEATHLLNQSFAQFVVDREVVRWERRLVEREREAAEVRPRAACELGDVNEYRDLRELAAEAKRSRRGSEQVRKALERLAPGDVIWGSGLGHALVCEHIRSSGGGDPKLTVMTKDRKLRRVGARDFRTPPEPVAKLRVRGHSWRSPKVRRGLVRELERRDLPRPQAPPKASDARDLAAAYQAHPVHSCPDAAEHLQAAERLRHAESDAANLRKRVRARRDTFAREFERVLEVLRAIGYIGEWGLTPKGDLLARVYNEADLLVVECLNRGWFSGLDPEELAAVVSVFVYEARGRDEPESAPTPHLSRQLRRVVNLYRSLHETEQQHGLDFLKEPDGGFMGVVYEWARGASLEDVLEERELSAGDFVRSAKQVVDLLQQLRQVSDQGPVAETLRDAVEAVQRGVVAYSSLV